MIDFVPKNPLPSAPAEAKADVSDSGESSAGALDSAGSPRPVMSAKAAINAMYAERETGKSAAAPASAREVVNAAAGQNAMGGKKTAANLHHGSIQKNIESVRTSASGLLRMAKVKKPSPIDVRSADSFDPLTPPKPAQPKTVRRPARSAAPVVRTSLKLGAAARPQPAPVILPRHSRMAEVARPVGSAPRPQPQASKLLNRRLVDAEVLPANETHRLINGSVGKNVSPLSLSSGESDYEAEIITAEAIEVANPSSRAARPVRGRGVRDPQMLHPGQAGARPAARRVAARPARTPQAASASGAPRNSQVIRDPQMVRTRRPVSAAARAARVARAADVVGEQMGQPAKFRSAPRGYAECAPAPLAPDNSYIMTEPPKITARPSAPDPSLGQVENYSESPAVGDRAPIGQISAQKVASGHGGAAFESAPATEPARVKADNTSDYSFSRKLEPDANRYALGGQSPFLKSVSVEKRPLSGEGAHLKTELKPARAEVNPKNSRGSNKNIYTKKSSPKSDSALKKSVASRPTVIVPSSHRSKAPMIILIIITIILGTAVGAAAYLCFFQMI